MSPASLHIGLVGPVATADVRHLLDDPSASLPLGYEGAPLLATLITELLRQGHRVSAFTLSSDLPLRRDGTRVVRGPRFELHLVPMRWRAWPFNGWRPGRIVDLYAFERGGLERAIAVAQPELVHAHWSYEFAWAALNSGLPHVVTCHDSPFVIARFQRDLRHGAYRWLRAGIAWHVLRRARHVTAVSPYLADQVQRLCRTRVGVVPNPLPSTALAVRDRPGIGVHRVLVVCNGWDPIKNPKPAMTAFSRWAEGHEHAELHLYGRGFEPHGPAHRWWNEAALQGRAVFHGPVAHTQLLEAMACGDVLLHGSLEESFGMVVAEAMASGTVVIAGDESGAVPWIVGENGVLVDVQDPAAIAQALFLLNADTARLRTLSERARRSTRRRFGVESVAQSYLQAYRQALRTRAAEPDRVAA